MQAPQHPVVRSATARRHLFPLNAQWRAGCLRSLHASHTPTYGSPADVHHHSAGSSPPDTRLDTALPRHITLPNPTQARPTAGAPPPSTARQPLRPSVGAARSSSADKPQGLRAAKQPALHGRLLPDSSTGAEPTACSSPCLLPGSVSVKGHTSTRPRRGTGQAEVAVQSPALTTRLTNAGNLEELASLLAAYGPEMNSVHLSAFMGSLARLAALPPVHSDASLDNAVGPSRSGWARKVAWAAGEQRQLASEARMQRAQQLARAAVQLISQVLSEFDAWGVAVVLRALAKLQLKDPLIADLVAVAQEQLPNCTGQCFSTLLHSLGALKVAPSNEFMAAYFTHSRPLLPRFSAQALSNTLWGLAQLGTAKLVHSREWEAAMFTAMRGVLNRSEGSAQAVSCMAWSLARLNLFPPVELQQALLDEGLRKLPEASPQGVANYMWAMGELRCPITDKWLHAVMKVTEPNLAGYSPLVLSTMLFALAVMGKPPAAPSSPEASSSSSAMPAGTAHVRLPVLPSCPMPDPQLLVPAPAGHLLAAGGAELLWPDRSSRPVPISSHAEPALQPCSPASARVALHEMAGSPAQHLPSSTPALATPGRPVLLAPKSPPLLAPSPPAGPAVRGRPDWQPQVRHDPQEPSRPRPPPATPAPPPSSTAWLLPHAGTQLAAELVDGRGGGPAGETASAGGGQTGWPQPRHAAAGGHGAAPGRTQVGAPGPQPYGTRGQVAAGVGRSCSSGRAAAPGSPAQPVATHVPAAPMAVAAVAQPGGQLAGAGAQVPPSAAVSWGQVLQGRLELLMNQCEPQICANVMYSYGKLNQMPPPGLLKALLRRSRAVMADMSPQGLANVIWALAKLQYNPNSVWVSEFLETSFQQLAFMNAQELSNMLWALVALEIQLDGMWMARFERASLAQLHMYNPQNLGNTLHSMATIRYCPSTEWQVAFQRRLLVKQQHVQAVQAADILWGAAQLRLSPTPQLQALTAVVTANVSSVSGSQLAAMLIAMVQQGWPLDHILLLEAEAELGTQLGALSLTCLSQLAWAMAETGHRPAPHWLQQLDVAVAAHMAAWLARAQAQAWAKQGMPGGSSQSPAARGLASRTHSAGKGLQLSIVGPEPQPPGPANIPPRKQQQLLLLEQQLLLQQQQSATLEGFCLWASVRPRLGPQPDPRLLRQATALLQSPVTLKVMTVPQLLQVVQGLIAMGVDDADQLVGGIMHVTSHMNATAQSQFKLV